MNGDHSLAVHALVYLDHRATHLPSQILAENICTNAARVRKEIGRASCRERVCQYCDRSPQPDSSPLKRVLKAGTLWPGPPPKSLCAR